MFKKISKKAQTATEYMIILAIVIIIALIVVGVLGQIPGIGVNAKSKSSAAYWQTSPIALTSWSLDVGGDLVLNIKNNMAESITITSVYISSNGNTNTNLSVRATDITLGIGSSYELTKSFVGAALTNVSPCNASGTVSSIGDSWTAKIEINYTSDETGASYSFDGDGNMISGTCAS